MRHHRTALNSTEQHRTTTQHTTTTGASNDKQAIAEGRIIVVIEPPRRDCCSLEQNPSPPPKYRHLTAPPNVFPPLHLFHHIDLRHRLWAATRHLLLFPARRYDLCAPVTNVRLQQLRATITLAISRVLLSHACHYHQHQHHHHHLRAAITCVLLSPAC